MTDHDRAHAALAAALEPLVGQVSSPALVEVLLTLAEIVTRGSLGALPDATVQAQRVLLVEVIRLGRQRGLPPLTVENLAEIQLVADFLSRPADA